MIAKAIDFLTGGWKWIAAIVVISSLAWLHGCQTGRQQEKDAQAAKALKAETKARGASESATASKETRDKQFSQQQEELKHEAKQGADSPVGPGITGVLERMREQQAGSDKTAR